MSDGRRARGPKIGLYLMAALAPLSCGTDVCPELERIAESCEFCLTCLDCSKPIEGSECTPGECYSDPMCPDQGFRCADDARTYEPDPECPFQPRGENEDLGTRCAYAGECIFVTNRWERCDEDGASSTPDETCASDECLEGVCGEYEFTGERARCRDGRWVPDETCDAKARRDPDLVDEVPSMSRVAWQDEPLPKDAKLDMAGPIDDWYCPGWTCNRNHPWGIAVCRRGGTDTGGLFSSNRETTTYAKCTDVLEFFANYAMPFDDTGRSLKDVLSTGKYIKIRETTETPRPGSGMINKIWVCDEVVDGKCKYRNGFIAGGKTPMIAIRKIAAYHVRLWGRDVKTEDAGPWMQRLPTAAELADFELGGNFKNAVQNAFCTNAMQPRLLDYRIDGDCDCKLTKPNDPAYPYNSCISITDNRVTAKPFLEQGRVWGDIPYFLKSDRETEARARQRAICIAGFVGIAASLFVPPQGFVVTAAVMAGIASGALSLGLSCADLFSSTDETFTFRAPITKGLDKRDFTELVGATDVLPMGATVEGWFPDVPQVPFKNGSVRSQGSMICVRDVPPEWNWEQEVTYERGEIDCGMFTFTTTARSDGTAVWQAGNKRNGAKEDWYHLIYDDSKWHIRLLEPCGIRASSLDALKQLYAGGGNDPALDAACTINGTNHVRAFINEAEHDKSQFGFYPDAKVVVSKWCAQYREFLVDKRPYGNVTDSLSRNGIGGVNMITLDDATRCEGGRP